MSFVRYITNLAWSRCYQEANWYLLQCFKTIWPQCGLQSIYLKVVAWLYYKMRIPGMHFLIYHQQFRFWSWPPLCLRIAVAIANPLTIHIVGVLLLEATTALISRAKFISLSSFGNRNYRWNWIVMDKPLVRWILGASLLPLTQWCNFIVNKDNVIAYTGKIVRDWWQFYRCGSSLISGYVICYVLIFLCVYHFPARLKLRTAAITFASE